ncbi:DUF6352 family protein [Comamonadaceae bacterium M7527]|nr:DUF6352 family protein [Comamonadaceae bacterium M7527]
MLKNDFWSQSGYALLHVDAQQQLVVTDAFLSFLLNRPELAPVDTSCDAERALFSQLVAQPRTNISDDQLAQLANPDVADNYRVWLRFRDRVLARPTLEASYMALFQGTGVDVPPVLVNQLTHVLVRHVLGAAPSALAARVGEMFFRSQMITSTDEGALLAADEEVVNARAPNAGFDLMGLLRTGGGSLIGVDLDVIGPDNQDVYWARDTKYDTVIALNSQQPAMKALCDLITNWVRHFLHVKVRITAQDKVQDKKWAWHLGLDMQSSAILNDLYLGKRVGDARLAQLLCLFKLEFDKPTDMLAKVAGKPVYMAMACDTDNRLRLKPQNLLLNLPLALRS